MDLTVSVAGAANRALLDHRASQDFEVLKVTKATRRHFWVAYPALIAHVSLLLVVDVLNIFTTLKRGCGMRSVASVCMSVCLCLRVRAATFESLDPLSSFLACKYIFRMSWSSFRIKVIGSRSRSQEQRKWLYRHSRLVCL